MKLFLSSLLVIAVVIGGVFLYEKGKSAPHAAETAASAFPTSTSSPAVIAPTAAPSGYKQYTNQSYRFSLSYPPELSVKEYDESRGATTIVFQDPSTNEGFQIFIAPYSGSEVSADRFREDEPSGVMQDPTNITIDGVSAVMFFGSNPVMGDTREVWFTHAGRLYEITAYKELDAWLSSILGTMKFSS